MDDKTLRTPDALAFAELSKVDWNNAVARGLIEKPPPGGLGHPRQFTVDDLVAAYVFGQLLQREVLASFASGIANDVHRQISEDHSIQTLSAWRVIVRGKPRVVVAERSPTPKAAELFRFEVASIRMRAIEGIRAKLREKRSL